MSPKNPWDQGPWSPNWPLPDEQLQRTMGRTGELPTPGNDRWGKSQQLTAQSPSYTFVNVGLDRSPYPTPMALAVSFSLDDITYTPEVPAAYGGDVLVSLIKAVDVKSGAFREDTGLAPGDALPFCTLISRGLTVNIRIVDESAGSLFVHCAACPAETVDCGSISSPPDAPWSDVFTARFPASTAGAFVGLAASPSAKQIFIQNNSAVDLLIGFGSLIPSLGPPPVYNLIIPGGFNGVYESQLGAFVGPVNAIFAGGGSATDYAVFTRGIA